MKTLIIALILSTATGTAASVAANANNPECHEVMNRVNAVAHIPTLIKIGDKWPIHF